MTAETRPAFDTVAEAELTPGLEHPYRDLGLKDEEYQQIREILGRRPTSSELAMYSVMWSEHCSYKSSKVHLRYFSDTMTDEMREHLMVGIGENAGVVDIGQGWAITFKVESHNHPSYVEPYQGAATGVGGIVRDILAMGARPVAVMDQLRFGTLDHPDTARLVHGVVAGVGGYGNCLGLPNIGGELVFDACYQGNPLVNALSVGKLRHEDLHLANASGMGNLVVLFGSRTGRDGIGGVSVLASETFSDSGPAKRPSVQVGDPFAEKVLIECCLELFEAGVVEGIQDLGGAGLSCATSELASAGDGGMRIRLDDVPLRDPSMPPEEVLMSESQERMMAVVRPDQLDAFMAITGRWEVLATVLGEVTGTGRLQISWRDEVIVDVPPRSVAHDGPVYHRPIRRSDGEDALVADSADRLARPANPSELRAHLLAVLRSPNVADKSWVTDQYDRYVMGNTAASMPDDAGVLRIDEVSGLGVAIATDCNARFTRLDPYVGAQHAVAEAYRNVACSGARPLAVTDCLNFGSPEDPAVMWQFEQAVHGVADACAALGLPVTGGNVSFYNSTGETAIHPTPVIGVLGVLEHTAAAVPSSWRAADLSLVLLGSTADELSGSAWAEAVHSHLGGRPPALDLDHEKRLASLLQAEAHRISSAHDLSDGGLFAALAECSLRHGVGASVDLPDTVHSDAFAALLAESSGRVLVGVPGPSVVGVLEGASAAGVPAVRIGRTGGSQLQVTGPGGVSLGFTLSELSDVWRRPLRLAFG